MQQEVFNYVSAMRKEGKSWSLIVKKINNNGLRTVSGLRWKEGTLKTMYSTALRKGMPTQNTQKAPEQATGQSSDEGLRASALWYLAKSQKFNTTEIGQLTQILTN